MANYKVYSDKKGNELKSWFTTGNDLFIEITSKGYPYTPGRVILPISDAKEIITELAEQLKSIKNLNLKGNE